MQTNDNQQGSRKRVLKALNHEEPDRVPLDIGGTPWTGIANIAYHNIMGYLGFPAQKQEFSDVIQQLALPEEILLEKLQVDTRGLFPLTSHNWDVEKKLEDSGVNWKYHDEWGMTHHFPKKEGQYFTIVKHPINTITPPIEDIENHKWPVASDKRRVKGLRVKALDYIRQGKIVMVKGLCAGLFEMHQRIRGMENAMIDPMVNPLISDLLIGKITDLKIKFWEMALEELGDVVDILGEGDDYGTQSSQLIPPETFREIYKPHWKRLLKSIKDKCPKIKIIFHSCGNVRPIIPDFIEMGVDILNPVHISAKGMEPYSLKKDFGKDITFWGGGIETQNILPYGNKEEIIDNVKHNIDAFAPGGGFVFSTVHNIQADVPPENIITMWNMLQEYGKY